MKILSSLRRSLVNWNLISNEAILMQRTLAYSKSKGSPLSIRKMSSEAAEDVTFHEANQARIITLNRPKALNALNLSMIRKIHPKLKEWDEDIDVRLVIIKGTGNKAFCAGGDVRAIAEAGKRGEDLTKTFFGEEYSLNYKIGTMKTPYIALLNGITMGGGVGLSVHGRYRVATEKTLFAMPETSIGFFPDVGGGYFLPKLEGNLGKFFAITGHRLKGQDVFHAGIATHFVLSSQVDELEHRLVSKGIDNPSEVLSEFHNLSIDGSHVFSLSEVQEKIDTIFSATSLQEIIMRMQDDGSHWSKRQLEIIQKMSPLSMCIAMRQLAYGAKMSLEDVLKMEYRISQRFMEGTDFYEGIRAVLVDKDHNPSWLPQKVANINDNEIDSYFQNLTPDRELMLT